MVRLGEVELGIGLDNLAGFWSTIFVLLCLMCVWASHVLPVKKGGLVRRWGTLSWPSLMQLGDEFGHCAADYRMVGHAARA